MKSSRPTPDPLVGDSTFLPNRITRAADRAMQQVLDEDAALRRFGIVPPSRSR